MFARTFLATATCVAMVLMMAGSFFVSTVSFEMPSFLTKQEFANQQRQIKCLADNVYYESANQSIEGKMGVAYVTINRSQLRSWPEDLCAVVYQKTQNLCQFSWVCENPKAPNQALWEQSLAVARHVWYKYTPSEDPTQGATYFHATYVRPGWKHTKTVQLGDHIFYK